MREQSIKFMRPENLIDLCNIVEYNVFVFDLMHKPKLSERDIGYTYSERESKKLALPGGPRDEFNDVSRLLAQHEIWMHFLN